MICHVKFRRTIFLEIFYFSYTQHLTVVILWRPSDLLSQERKVRNQWSNFFFFTNTTSYLSLIATLVYMLNLKLCNENNQ